MVYLLTITHPWTKPKWQRSKCKNIFTGFLVPPVGIKYLRIVEVLTVIPSCHHVEQD